MKKRILVSLLTLAMAALVLVGCGEKSTATSGAVKDEPGSAAESAEATSTEATAEEEVEEATSTITVDPKAEGYVFKHGFDKDFPPYAQLGDDGKTTGFDIELAQAVCDYYGWEYKAVPFSWEVKTAELNAGSCDCIWSGFTMNNKEDKYLWSKPYSNNEQMIMVRSDSDIKSLNDLAGKIVAVQIDTSAFDMLDSGAQKELRATFGDLQVEPDYPTACNDLKAGAVDAVAIDKTAGDHLMKKNKNLKYLGETLGTEQYGVAFRKGDTELCKMVNDALDALSANGTVAKLLEKEEYSELKPLITIV